MPYIKYTCLICSSYFSTKCLLIYFAPAKFMPEKNVSFWNHCTPGALHAIFKLTIRTALGDGNNYSPHFSKWRNKFRGKAKSFEKILVLYQCEFES